MRRQEMYQAATSMMEDVVRFYNTEKDAKCGSLPTLTEAYRDILRVAQVLATLACAPADVAREPAPPAVGWSPSAGAARSPR